MTGAQKSRLPRLQFAGFSLAPNLAQNAAVRAVNLRRRHAVFFKGRRMADEIIPGGVLNRGGNILVSSRCDLRADHVAEGFAQCDSVTYHGTTLFCAHNARKFAYIET